MKTTPDASTLLSTIGMLDKKLHDLFEGNKDLFLGPVSTKPGERAKLKDLRDDQASMKKWREASVSMLVRELLEANK